MIPVFDQFVGVDWSGAGGKGYPGIALAECRLDTAAPSLVPPPGRRWTRTDFVDWVVREANGPDRMLIGIDCAFALPAATASALLGDGYDASALWAHIEVACGDGADYFGGGFADHPDRMDHFWRAGPRPAGFAEHHRAGELACRAAGFGAPESPLKLVGARQVGKGGLAGMRVLHALKQKLGHKFAVWPFQVVDEAQVVCVELYPRLFMRMAKHGNGKVRSRDALNACLAVLESDPYVDDVDAASDHETDALVAAAGLRRIAGDDTVWYPRALDALARRAEGWIFGVT